MNDTTYQRLTKATYYLIGLFLCSSNALANTLNEENQYVHNATAQFNALSEYGEWSGYWLGLNSQKTQEPITPTPFADQNASQHYQGIARSNGPGIPYLYVTRSGEGGCTIGNTGTLDVVELASRDTSGERLRSNRLQLGTETKDTVPPTEDKTVKTIVFNDYWHPGGVAVIGDILAVALEGSSQPCDTSIPGSVVRFYDISDPSAPAFLYDFVRPSGSATTNDSQLGFVGLVKWKDRHIMMVPADGDSVIQFYQTTGKSLATSSEAEDWEHITDIFRVDQGFPSPPNAFQNMHFLVQRASSSEAKKLFVVASHNTGEGPPQLNGSNYVRLYQVDDSALDEDAPQIALNLISQQKKELSSAGNYVASFGDFFDTVSTVTAGAAGGTAGAVAGGIAGGVLNVLVPVPGFGSFVGSILGGIFGGSGASGAAGDGTGFIPGEPDNFAKQEANFNASGYAYVSPSGELLYYSTSFYNRGPSGITRFAELARTTLNSHASCTQDDDSLSISPRVLTFNEGDTIDFNASTSIPGPWATLYEHHNFEGRKAHYDWQDRHLEDWHNFKKLNGNQAGDPGFSDKVSSFQYCLPDAGWTFELFDDDGYEKPIYRSNSLQANGRVVSDGFSGNGEDKTTSMRILPPSGCSNQEGSYQWSVASTYGAGIQSPSDSQIAEITDIDGGPVPSFVDVTLDYTPPCATQPLNRTYSFEIENSAPSLSNPVFFDGSSKQIGKEVLGAPPGLVSLEITYSDAADFASDGSNLDQPFHILVDWGDGTTSEQTGLNPDSFPAVLKLTHQYASGEYFPSVTVTDKDGSSSTESTQLDVDPQYALLQDDFDNYFFDDFSQDNLADYTLNAEGSVFYDPSMLAVIDNTLTIDFGVDEQYIETRLIQNNAELDLEDAMSIDMLNVSISSIRERGLMVLNNADYSMADGYEFVLRGAQVGSLTELWLTVYPIVQGIRQEDKAMEELLVTLPTRLPITDLSLTLTRDSENQLALELFLFSVAVFERSTQFDLNDVLTPVPTQLHVGVYTSSTTSSIAKWDNWSVTQMNPPFAVGAGRSEFSNWTRKDITECPVSQLPYEDIGSSPSGGYALAFTDHESCRVINTTTNDSIELSKEVVIPFQAAGGDGPSVSWWQYVDKNASWDLGLSITRSDSQDGKQFKAYQVPVDHTFGWHQVVWPLEFEDGSLPDEDISIGLMFQAQLPEGTYNPAGWFIDDFKIDFGTSVAFACKNNALGDPSFEAGVSSPFWENDNNGEAVFSTGNANSGRYAFELGADGNNDLVSVNQTLTIPELSDARLRFAFSVQGGCDTNCASEGNFIEILIDEQVVWRHIPEQATTENENSSGKGYVLESVNISEFADGDIHTLTIRGESDNQAIVRLDDVCLGPFDACHIDAINLGENLDEPQLTGADGQVNTTLISNLAITLPEDEAFCEIGNIEVIYQADGEEVGRTSAVKAGFAASAPLPALPLAAGASESVSISATATMLSTNQSVSTSKQVDFLGPLLEPSLGYAVTPSQNVGKVQINVGSQEVRITVTNTQSDSSVEALELGDVSLPSTPWVLVQDDCSDAILSSLESCYVQLAFTPSEVGEFTDMVSLTSNDAQQESIDITLLGVGVDEALESELVRVPAVSSLTLAQAEDDLTLVNLIVGDLSEEYNATLPAGSVVRQTPIAGEEVPVGSPVALILSLGTEPSLIGDFDLDGDVDSDDMNFIIARLNQPGTDENSQFDLDGNGTITMLDARKLILLCTRARCATE